VRTSGATSSVTFPRILRCTLPCFRTFLLCIMEPGLTVTATRGFLQPQKVGV
jgi:hypothetical protein